jgi:hypothetical protein
MMYMSLIGTIYTPTVPKAPPNGGNHIQNRDEEQGGGIGDRKNPGSSLIKEGQYRQRKAQKLTSPIAHKYFCLGKGQIEKQEPPDSRNQADTDDSDRTGKGSENNGIGHDDDDREAPGKAVYPVNEVDGVGESHNPQKGKGNPEPGNHPEIIFKKEQMAEHITGEDNQKARNDLDKKFGSGIQGTKVIKYAAYQRNAQTHKYRNKPEAQMNICPGKYKNQGNNDKRYGKPYTPQARDIPSMDFSFINPVKPSFFTRQAEYQPHGYE